MSLVFSTLGEEATIIMGQSPPGDSYNRDGKGAPLLNGPSEFGPDHPREVQWTTSPTKFCKTGDVLFCVRGATAGRLNTADKEYCIGRGLAAIRGKTGKFDSGFLRYVLANGYARFQARGVGSTFINISAEELMRFPVPTLPFSEQRRIAAILDQAETLRAKRRQALAKLDTLTRSLFLEIDSSSTKIAQPISFREIATFTTGKLDSNAAVQGGAFPFFTCAKEGFFIDTAAFDCDALLLAGNNAAGEYSVKHYKGKFNAYQRTYVITLDESICSYEYMQLALSEKLRELKHLSKGTGTKYLTLEILHRLKFHLPELAIQQKFSTQVTNLEKRKRLMEKSQTAMDGMFVAAQKRAFRGEL